MTGTGHEDIHRDLGVYVLGALEPAERDRFERHLAGCATCRDELADLAVLPSLLSRLGDPAAGAIAAPSFDRIVERLARERRRIRRRERLVAGAAAVAAVVAVVALFAGPVGTGETGVAYASDDGLVTATVESKPWGMEVHIVASDLPARRGYVAEAVARDGHRSPIASWSATGGAVNVTGACYLDAAELARVEIKDPADDDVLAVLTSG